MFDKLLMGLGITDEPMRLLYTYPAVVVGMIYALLPFMIFAVYSSAEKLDWSLIEAARDLGASRIRAFFTVTLKLTLPGLLSGVILTFQYIPSMGLFFIADILGGNKVVLVGSLIQDPADEGAQLAVRRGARRDPDDPHERDDRPVPEDLRRQGSRRPRVSGRKAWVKH